MNENKEKDKHVIGDLLWAKIGNHPFWPCMVSYDPIEGNYSRIRKVRNGDARIYHVQYFGKLVQHGWTTPSLIFPFEGEEKFYEYRANLLKDVSSTKKKELDIKYNIPPAIKNAWLFAVREAEMALSVNIQERYENFVFKYEMNPKKSESSKETTKKHRKRKKSFKNTSNKPTKQARKASSINENLCKMCEKGGVDLTCTGNCLQSYHKECLGIICVPKNFKCLDCENGLNSCYVCKISDTSVIKCSKCNYHYHDNCLKKYPCANYEKKICPVHLCLTCYNENPRNIPTKGPFVRCFRCPTIFHATENCLPVGSVKLTPSLIICPDHFLGKNKVSPQPTCNVSYCSICSEGGELICCEACPSSYHKECINGEVPAGDFFCEDCAKREYLYIGMVVWAKTGHFRWWPAQIISENDLPLNIKNLNNYDGEFPVQYFGTDEYYWTHRGRVIPYAEDHKTFNNAGSNSKPCKLTSQYKISLEEAKEAYDEYISEKENQKRNGTGKPDAYKHIKVNRAVPPAHINVVDPNSVLPCACNPNKPNPCSKDTVCLNRSMLIECHPDVCLAGDRCENQKFQRRQYPSVKVVKTDKRGWGLISQEFIPKGSFVIEYVGEIITHEEYRNRTIQMREENYQNYYFLYIDSRRMIDAGPKGNLARFINHSCNPNCQMEKWSVNGDLRIGIFALEDIQPGEELTFNYYSDSIPFQQKCYCEAPNCKGFIGKNGDKPSGKKEKFKKSAKERKALLHSKNGTVCEGFIVKNGDKPSRKKQKSKKYAKEGKVLLHSETETLCDGFIGKDGDKPSEKIQKLKNDTKEGKVLLHSETETLCDGFIGKNEDKPSEKNQKLKNDTKEGKVLLRSDTETLSDGFIGKNGDKPSGRKQKFKNDAKEGKVLLHSETETLCDGFIGKNEDKPSEKNQKLKNDTNEGKVLLRSETGSLSDGFIGKNGDKPSGKKQKLKNDAKEGKVLLHSETETLSDEFIGKNEDKPSRKKQKLKNDAKEEKVLLHSETETLCDGKNGDKPSGKNQKGKKYAKELKVLLHKNETLCDGFIGKNGGKQSGRKQRLKRCTEAGKDLLHSKNKTLCDI